jgi:hypothetical protein
MGMIEAKVYANTIKYLRAGKIGVFIMYSEYVAAETMNTMGMMLEIVNLC